jgi:hypothetical protein
MDNITQIQLGKSKINNPNEIVNVFNKHFITIAEKLTKNSDINEAIKLLDTFKNDNIPEMKLIPTAEIKRKYILKSLKLKNSTGYDGISSRMLKCCIDEIGMPLSNTFNESLKHGICPERLKYTLVRPIYKTGKKQIFQTIGQYHC